jgi:hypothetical protein
VTWPTCNWHDLAVVSRKRRTKLDWVSAAHTGFLAVLVLTTVKLLSGDVSEEPTILELAIFAVVYVPLCVLWGLWRNRRREKAP